MEETIAVKQDQSTDQLREEEAAEKPVAYTYMLRCCDGSLYTGWTNNLQKRLQSHQSGCGGKYTRTHRPVKLVYSESFSTKEEAMRREWQIKHLTKAQKEALVRQGEEKTAERNERKHDTDFAGRR